MTAIGDRVGHFRILGVLGRGGMGEVYDGFDETLHRRVALKAIHAERRLDESARTRFLREARLLSQLDHPAICRIYDYVESDDCDLLALELIEGRTLRTAIADGLQFHDKLRIATDVARALVAAHRLGIVHRDLKPDNIMITAAGEVKVLDFGLARSASDEQAPAEAMALTAAVEIGEADATQARPSSPSPVLPDSHTRAGDIIGTPSYMSPEQARGEAVTTASDVYSLGLVLQTLFTGKRPHEENIPVFVLLRRAREGEWLPVTGVDRAVGSLINSLKVKAPSDRPTALDVVKKLEWIAGRTRRRWRRAAIAAAVVAVIVFTIKYVADVQRERNVAMQARADAERRRGQAEELIGFMVGDLRTKLEPVGRLDILDDVGEQALRYFRSLRPDEIDPAEMRRNAKTLSQIGEVRMLQGNLEAAHTVLATSIVLASSAVERNPADAENTLQLGASEFWMGSLLRQQGDLEGARDHYTKYLRLSETLAALDPKNMDYQLEVGYGHSNVGTVLEQLGDQQRALEHYQKAMAIKERRLATAPDRADWNADFATTVNKVAVVLRGLGRYEEAEAALQREHDLLTFALEREPDNAPWRFRLAVNRSFMGDAHEDQGDLDAALRMYEAEVAIEQQLVAHDPAHSGWQRSLAVNRMKAARVVAARGRLDEAQAMLRSALDRIEPLVAKDPKRVLWRRDMTKMHEGLALIHLERNDLAAAEREIAAAGKVIETMPLNETDSRRVADTIALTRGMILQRSGDAAAARREWTRVAASLEPLLDDPAPSPADLDTLARALLLLDRVGDATPVVERLFRTGYRRHGLAVLWEERRQQSPGALAQKG